MTPMTPPLQPFCPSSVAGFVELGAGLGVRLRRGGGKPSRRRALMNEGSFHRVISEHRALAQRNKRLEATMPLDLYREQYGHRLAYDPRIAPSATAAADAATVTPGGTQAMSAHRRRSTGATTRSAI